MSFFISSAMAQAADSGAQQASPVTFYLLMGGMAIMFYFMLWRPQSKRAKEHKALMEGMQKGDEVMTSGGILGRIKKISGEYIVLQISDTVDIRIQKSSVMATLPKDTLKAIDKATD